MLRLSALIMGLLLVFSSANHASAQSTELGFIGGINISDLSGDDLDADTRTSFHVGGFANFDISDIFSIQPEVVFTQKGADILDFGDIATLGIETSYIEVPVLGMLSFPAGGSTQGHFVFGPAIAFETGCDVVGSVLTVQSEVACENFEIDEGTGETLETESVDFGVIVGGGVNFEVGDANLFVDGRFNIGLTNISDTSSDDDVKNRNFSVSVGVGFPIG